MQLLIIRISRTLKSSLKKLSEETGRSISDVARDLAIIGIDMKKNGGVEIVGPLGIRRWFTRLSFGEEKEEKLAIWINEKLKDSLEKEFNLPLRTALREAILLGLLRLLPQDVEIRGVFGIIRPFATVTFPEPSEEVKEAIKRLKCGKQET
ncbi:MAG: hypothetical protein ACTSSJ_04160 [Candidatus Odinarchaeia archaeon]